MQDRYEFFHPNSSGLFSPTLKSPHFESGCRAQSSVTFRDDADLGNLIRTCSSNKRVHVEGFAVKLSQVEQSRPRSLPQCLSDVDSNIERLGSIDAVEDLTSNMIHVDDDFVFNGTVTATDVQYQQASFDSVQV